MALAVPMSGSDRFAQFVMGFPWRRTRRQRIVDDAEEFGVEVDWWTSTTLTMLMFIPVPPNWTAARHYGRCEEGGCQCCQARAGDSEGCSICNEMKAEEDGARRQLREARRQRSCPCEPCRRKEIANVAREVLTEPAVSRPAEEPRSSSNAESGNQPGLVPADSTSAAETERLCPVQPAQVPPAEASAVVAPEVVAPDPSLYQAILASTDGDLMMELFRQFMWRNVARSRVAAGTAWSMELMQLAGDVQRDVQVLFEHLLVQEVPYAAIKNLPTAEMVQADNRVHRIWHTWLEAALLEMGRDSRTGDKRRADDATSKGSSKPNEQKNDVVETGPVTAPEPGATVEDQTGSGVTSPPVFTLPTTMEEAMVMSAVGAATLCEGRSKEDVSALLGAITAFLAPPAVGQRLPWRLHVRRYPLLEQRLELKELCRLMLHRRRQLQPQRSYRQRRNPSSRSWKSQRRRHTTTPKSS